MDNGANLYPVLPTSGQGTPPNAGQIAYLFNHYGTLDIGGPNDNGAAASIAKAANLPVDATAEAAGLQVAIWELEYGTNLASISALSPTTAAEVAAINSYVTFYLGQAANKSETATFLEVNGSPLQGGEQGMIATGSLNFGNIYQPMISTGQQPASAVVGASISDTATLSGLVSPTGTVTFTLTNGTGAVLYTSPAEALTATGTPGTYTAMSPGYTATATGTDYWVASFGGDANNRRSPAARPPSR